MHILKHIFLLGSLLIADIPSTHAEESKDTRTLVTLPADIEEKMMILMRDHIRALEDMIHAIQAEDYDKAKNIAESRLSWKSSVRSEDREVIKHWPKSMQAMADQLYHAASSYVDISQKAANKDSKNNSDTEVIKALGTMITACRSCHESYRLN